MGRYLAADLGNSLQFLPPVRVVLVSCHLQSLLGVPFGEPNHGVGRNRHRPKLLALSVSIGIVQEVEAAEARLNVSLQVEQALAVDDIAKGSVAGSPLFHEFGEDARLVSVLPFL